MISVPLSSYDYLTRNKLLIIFILVDLNQIMHSNKSFGHARKWICLYGIIFLALNFILVSTCSGNEKADNTKVFEEKVRELEKELAIQKNQNNNITQLYQTTNDRLNNYLSYTANVAAIFGILIALAGIYIGFESLKSQNRNNQAVRTLEEAKTYVEGKKNDFDDLILSKKAVLEEDYKKITDLIRERLLTDIEVETSKVKRIAELKTEEISSLSMPESHEKTLNMLEKRLEFFENIGIPDDPEILFSKAKLLVEKKMIAGAIELFEKVVEKVPEHPMAYFHLGYNYSILKDSTNSIKNYQKHLIIAPDSPGAHNNLALQYKDKDKLLDALEHFDRALAINPDVELYNNNKIDVLLKLKSFTKVIEIYRKLISLKPIPKYYHLLLKYLKQENRFEETVICFDEAIEVFKEDTDLSNSYKLLKAQFIGEKGKKEDAINIYQSLISEGYSLDSCYMNIADLRYELGDRKLAIEILDNGIASNPLSSYLYIKKAFIELDKGQKKAEAILVDGGNKINNENYFLVAGRFFQDKSKPSLANFCYGAALKIVESKLTEPGERAESDMMNFFETSIIIGKDTAYFDENFRSEIQNEKYKIILVTLDTIVLVAKGLNDKVKNEAIRKLKDLNLEAREEKETGWDFNDILIYIEKNYDSAIYGFVQKITKYIKREISLDVLQA